MTRRQQWVQRQLKYKQRRDRMYQRGWAFVLSPSETLPGAPLTPHHAGRRTPLWNGGKQLPLRIKTRGGKVILTPVIEFPPVTFTLSAVGPKHPGHVTFTGLWRAIVDSAPSRHLHRAYIRYHLRGVKYVGHKPDRMNGYQRKCWGAARVAYFEGYFPEWDPLSRHPTEADIIAGADPYGGPFPQTPGH